MNTYVLIGVATLAVCLAVSTEIFVDACRQKGISLTVGCLSVVLLWPVLVAFFVLAVIRILLHRA